MVNGRIGYFFTKGDGEEMVGLTPLWSAVVRLRGSRTTLECGGNATAL